MTVRDLINELQQINLETPVKAYDREGKLDDVYEVSYSLIRGYVVVRP